MNCKDCEHFIKHYSDNNYGDCFKVEYEAGYDVIAIVGVSYDCIEPAKTIVGYMFGCIHFQKK